MAKPKSTPSVTQPAPPRLASNYLVDIWPVVMVHKNRSCYSPLQQAYFIWLYPLVPQKGGKHLAAAVHFHLKFFL